MQEGPWAFSEEQVALPFSYGLRAGNTTEGRRSLTRHTGDLLSCLPPAPLLHVKNNFNLHYARL